ncbi:galactose-specific lectin nattectin-like, partial [Larimichthys crocea]|uniref:galactose-specific lectin nattectin-like n=1 Tax=Larimichthys crocea TaxID=215358 RepID=UPI000F5DCC4A
KVKCAADLQVCKRFNIFFAEARFPCPEYWSYFSGTCFIFHESLKTWIEAEAYCLFEEANLASIHSDGENNFVQALTQTWTDFPKTWIGGHNAVHPSFWMWSDGSRFDYENWFEEPQSDRDEHCLKMNFG